MRRFLNFKPPDHLSLKDAVEWMLTQDPRSLEFHWLLQSEYCELHSRVREYDFILLYTKENYGADATCLMERAGIQRFNSMGPNTNHTPVWTARPRDCDQQPLLDKGLAIEADSNACAEDEEVTHLELLFPQDVARRLVHHLQQDYITFNIPEPSWIDEATGVLYETPLRELRF